MVEWVESASLWLVGTALLVCMGISSLAGYGLRNRLARDTDKTAALSSSQEGYVVSAVLGLLALLMGFSFSLAIDRFDARRILVRDDANAIGTAYLRTQLLGEPHRTRLSGLLVAYTENRLILATAPPNQIAPRLAKDDRILTEIWAADAAAFDSIKHLDFSSAFIESMNIMIDLDASRRAAHLARVPSEVFILLLVYLIVTAGVLGYALLGLGGRLSGGVLLLLLTFSLLLILDIDSPSNGAVREQQRPLEVLLRSLKSHPPGVYDRWRMPAQP